MSRVRVAGFGVSLDGFSAGIEQSLDDPLGKRGSEIFNWYFHTKTFSAMLGKEGEAFKVAQARLGGGRIHHAMRTVGQCQRAIDMMIERAVSRRTKGRPLGDHQFAQGMIADSIMELEQFRLLILKAAWTIDEVEAGRLPHGAARPWIAMCKIGLARVFHDIARRAVHLHGSLGVSNETPLAKMWAGAPTLAIADGPTEVHQVQLARHFLRQSKPGPRLFGSDHIPTRLEQARAWLAEREREAVAAE